jgi:hypothetical protein
MASTPVKPVKPAGDFHPLVTGPGDFSSFLAIRFFFRALAWIPAPFSEMAWFSEMETPMEYRNWGSWG